MSCLTKYPVISVTDFYQWPSVLYTLWSNISQKIGPLHSQPLQEMLAHLKKHVNLGFADFPNKTKQKVIYLLKRKFSFSGTEYMWEDRVCNGEKPSLLKCWTNWQKLLLGGAPDKQCSTLKVIAFCFLLPALPIFSKVETPRSCFCRQVTALMTSQPTQSNSDKPNHNPTPIKIPSEMEVAPLHNPFDP